MDHTPSSAARAAANQTPKPNAREATEQNVPPAQTLIQTDAIVHSNSAPEHRKLLVHTSNTKNLSRVPAGNSVL